MGNIPTAEEILDKHLVPVNAMIEFAKLHVKAALEEASKTKKIELFVRSDTKGSKYKKVEPGEKYDIFGTRQMWKVNKESILNSYSEENIK
jgi:hypothetical protein